MTGLCCTLLFLVFSGSDLSVLCKSKVFDVKNWEFYHTLSLYNHTNDTELYQNWSFHDIKLRKLKSNNTINCNICFPLLEKQTFH